MADAKAVWKTDQAARKTAATLEQQTQIADASMAQKTD